MRRERQSGDRSQTAVQNLRIQRNVLLLSSLHADEESRGRQTLWWEESGYIRRLEVGAG